MITPEYLNEIMYGVEDRLSVVNNAILKKIVERIKASFKKGEDNILIPSTIADIKRLVANGVLVEDVQKAVIQSLPLIQDAIQDAFYKSAEEISKQNIEVVQNILDAAQITTVKVPEYVHDELAERAAQLNMSKYNLRHIEEAYRRTNGEMKNLTRSTAAQAEKTYIEACDNAYMKVKSGMSTNTAIVDAIKEVSEKGAQVVNYRSGKVENIEVAIGRAVRTGINQANANIILEECARTGINYIKTSAHLGARVTKNNDYTNHSYWQGKIYAINWNDPVLASVVKSVKSEQSEPWKEEMKRRLEEKQKKFDYPDFIESTGYGNILGLCGINCRHTFYRYYPSEKVENKLAFDEEKNEKRYNLEQQQRRMERAIRKTKRKLIGLDAAGLDSDEMRQAKYEAKELLKEQSERYTQFCEKNNLKISNWRQEIAGPASGGKKTGAASGALNDKNDPLGEKRAKHAEKYYNSIRNRNRDSVIEKLSNNGGIDLSDAENVYKHVFKNEHTFESGEVKRFEPDYDMSQSFQRILEGKNIQPHDITLLKHEMLEFKIMSKYNMVYEDAHRIAEAQYNYSKELKEFLGKVKS